MRKMNARWLMLMLLTAACHASSSAARAPLASSTAGTADTADAPAQPAAALAASTEGAPAGGTRTGTRAAGAVSETPADSTPAGTPARDTPSAGARLPDAAPSPVASTDTPPPAPAPAPPTAGVRRARPHHAPTQVASNDTAKRRITGVATIAGRPTAGVTVALGQASTRTGADGRYVLGTDIETGLPSAKLDGWTFEAHPADNGEVNFAAFGVTLSGELPASVTVTPMVTDGVRKAVVTRDAPGKRWKWKLELTPAGPLDLSASAPGFKLILDPELSRVPLVVARRDKTGINFIRVCDVEGTLALGAASDGATVPPPITGVVSLDVKPRFWVPEPATHQMSQVNKQFQPDLLVVRLGDTVEFINEEPDTQMQHQVTADEPNPKKFEASTRGVTGRQVFTTLGVTPIRCAIHSSMHADVFVVKTPFAKRTDANGHWRIADVPEGTWALTALEPNGGTAEQAGVKACGGPVTVRLRQRPPRPVACRPDEYECLPPLP